MLPLPPLTTLPLPPPLALLLPLLPPPVQLLPLPPVLASIRRWGRARISGQHADAGGVLGREEDEAVVRVRAARRPCRKEAILFVRY